ncbi:MAG: DUF192 domain-containing protein [Bacteroidota bacterium]
MATSRKSPTKKPYRPKKRTNWSQIIIVALLGLALVSFILTSIPGFGGGPPPPPPAPAPAAQPAPPPPMEPTAPATPPEFMDDGDLAIYRDGQEEPVTEIDIEIVADVASITQGLMWRTEMAADQGMLFLMPVEKPQSFWMKNTYIPLDIIFADANKKIVKIRRNTTPRSLDQVLSEEPALYVLEVNAGFADRHKLKEGDILEW